MCIQFKFGKHVAWRNIVWYLDWNTAYLFYITEKITFKNLNVAELDTANYQKWLENEVFVHYWLMCVNETIFQTQNLVFVQHINCSTNNNETGKCIPWYLTITETIK